MGWLRDAAWQQGVAIILVVAGSVLIYRGGAGTGVLGARALIGVVLFASGIALPLISQLFGERRQSPGKNEDV